MKLHTINPDVRYWAVRPGAKGVYFEHFRANNLMCLGHMDDVAFTAPGNVDEESLEYIFSSLTRLNEERPENERENVREMSIKQAQIRTFIAEMAIGDLVFTMKSGSVMIGTIKSQAYLDSSVVSASDGRGSNTQMRYRLRRDVEWEYPKNRDDMPLAVRASLTANQTVFSLESHRLMLNHWLYSMFADDDKLYFSTKINAVSGVSQFHVTEFQRVIQQLELLTELIDSGFLNSNTELNGEFYAEVNNLYITRGLASQFTLTTKNAFMSPGNIWSEMESNTRKGLIFSLLLMASFGVAASDAQQQQLDSECRQVITRVSESFNETTRFEMFKNSISAELDSPNKGIPAVRMENVAERNDVVFPEDDENGVTGI